MERLKRGTLMAHADPRSDVILFCDWDETITAHDTLSLIAPPDGEHPGQPFADYGKAYMDDLEQHETQWKQAQGKSVSASPRQRLEKYIAFLASLDAVELASQKRIEDGELFLGCDPRGIEERAAEHVQLREGWRDFARRWVSQQQTSDSLPSYPSPLETHIISVGWSARFIAAGLRDTCKPTSICANEVEIDSTTGRGSGRLTKSRDAASNEPPAYQETQDAAIPSYNAATSSTLVEGRAGIRIAQHKVREMRRILAARRAHVRGSGVCPIVIYAGDSITDLGALLEADIGLILGDKASLRTVLVDELHMSEDTTGQGTSDESIGRFFASVDAALPHVKASINDVLEESSAPARIDEEPDGSGMPRLAGEHRAFLVHVSNWHEASCLLEAVMSA